MSALHTNDFSVVTIKLYINNASLGTVNGMIEHLADKYKLLIGDQADPNPQECIIKHSVDTIFPDEPKEVRWNSD